MGRSRATRLCAIPNANGTLTRLAYARLQANGIETGALPRRRIRA
jgi:hypothetical protein